MYTDCFYELKDNYVNSTSAQRFTDLGGWARREVKDFSTKENKDNKNWKRFCNNNHMKSKTVLNMIKAARTNASNEDLIVQQLVVINGTLLLHFCTHYQCICSIHI